MGEALVREVAKDVVLVHGFPLSQGAEHQSDNTPLKAALEARYAARLATLAAAFDAQGHGGSGRGPENGRHSSGGLWTAYASKTSCCT